MLRAVLPRDPTNLEWQERIANDLDEIGGLKVRVRDIDGARKAYTEAVEAWRNLLKGKPNDADWQIALANSLEHLANLVPRAQGQKFLQEAASILEALDRSGKLSARWQDELKAISKRLLSHS
jgi:hypothetical protein